MSVRHQVRQFVESLFEGVRKEAQKGEYTVFNVYSRGEDWEIVDVKVDFSDSESVKKFLDRTTRETLEGEVKGLKLFAMVLDKDGEYFFSSEVPIEESLKEEIVERIEQLKEE